LAKTIDNETLGGATTQCEISGVTDNKCKDDADCLTRIRNIMDKLGKPADAGFDRVKPLYYLPKKDPKEIFGILPDTRDKQYDMHEIIYRLVDNSEFDEYKAAYGQSIICGLARIDGWAVGIVANQRKVVKSKKGEMQFGGVIYSDSADKTARFIMNCNQRKIPLVFLQDVTGFMVGSRSEHGGIIKDGAKLVNAMSNSVVPKFTVIVGNSYGAGNYAMCGKAYDPRLIVGWPSAQVAVMGGAQAAKVLCDSDLIAVHQSSESKIHLVFNSSMGMTDTVASPPSGPVAPWYPSDPLEFRVGNKISNNDFDSPSESISPPLPPLPGSPPIPPLLSMSMSGKYFSVSASQ
jgi:3-methylcrotonyl-CoA carboxylase beta subunit